VAGTPTSFGYDADTDVFHLAYSAKGPDGEVVGRRLRTRVYVPRSHYPDGFDVDARGATVTFPPDTQYVILKRRAGAANVRVTVTPN
jgi:hypothetical protein